MLKLISKKSVIVLVEILLPLLFAFVCQRLSIGRWFDFNLNVIFLNYILWCSLLFFFISIFKSHRIGLSFFLTFFLFFSITNRYRIKFLNDPIRFNDLNMVDQLPQILPFISNYKNFKLEIFLSFTLLVFILFVINKFIKIKFNNIWFRFFVVILSVNIFFSPYLYKGVYSHFMNINKIVFGSWYRLENCQNNGMILCFINDLQHIKREPIAGYSKDVINNILSKSDSVSAKDNIQPNVILILSESLWDVTKLENIKFSPDPISNIRRDIKGNFVSPSYGGGTANVEFEILTGLSNYLLEQGDNPYTDLITRNTPSLFTVFKNNKYFTSVIHPYSQQFYNRKNIYKHFGLDNFISLDQMTSIQTSGPYVSDKYFVDQILKQFDSKKESQFIFGISMQNHDIYEANRYGTKMVDIQSKLNKNDNDALQTYTDGTYLTDRAYKYLKEELVKQKDKPTIVITFGDHLPFLTDDYSVFKTSDYIKNDEVNWNRDEQLKMHTTPIAVWANYKTDISNIGDISPEILSNKILDLAYIQPEYQFKFVKNIEQNIPILTKKVTSDLTNFGDLINDYRQIQYDILFGNQYIKSNK